MDFIGDEDAVRYALEVAFRKHDEDTRLAGVAQDSLPSADVARVFARELAERGWKLVKDQRE